MAVSFKPLQPTLGVAHSDLRLVCGCSAMENHFMKFQTNSSCADVASRGSLELSSEFQKIFYALLASALVGPILLACVAYHFVAEPLLLLL
jgi:hypothetical protein